MTILCAVPGCPGLALDHIVCSRHCDCGACNHPSELSPEDTEKRTE